jgi:hypothetical protein
MESHGQREGRRASTRVIEAVARREGISPASLQPPLYVVVDPDALDEMFRNAHDGTRVIVEYYGYEIEVTADFVRVRSAVDDGNRGTATAD